MLLESLHVFFLGGEMMEDGCLQDVGWDSKPQKSGFKILD